MGQLAWATHPCPGTICLSWLMSKPVARRSQLLLAYRSIHYSVCCLEECIYIKRCWLLDTEGDITQMYNYPPTPICPRPTAKCYAPVGIAGRIRYAVRAVRQALGSATPRRSILPSPPKGEILIGPDLDELIDKAVEKLGSGNFIFKIGDVAVGKWL